MSEDLPEAGDWPDEDVFEAIESLFDQGRFEEVRARLDALDPSVFELSCEERAWRLFTLAACLDRLGEPVRADSLWSQAAELEPVSFAAPLRLAGREFESLVERALESLPDHIASELHRVELVIRDYPGDEAPDPFCLGLYLGVPRTERDLDERDDLDLVLIYKRSLEVVFTAEELAEEVRKTVIHEIGHHFGLEEDDMGEYA